MPQIDIAKLRLLNQQLLSPQMDDPVDVVRWMGAMQAQELPACLWAIGMRMKHPDGKRVLAAYDRGEIVRTHLNRATWHMVAARDLPWMLMLHGERSARAWRNFALATGGPLTDEMMEGSRCLLQHLLQDGQALTREELTPSYRSMGILDDREVRHLLCVAEAEGVICSGPFMGRSIAYRLVSCCVPPDAVTLTHDEALATLATRYFLSHAPATFADYVWWSGLAAGDCKRSMALIASDLKSVCVDGETYYLHVQCRNGRMPRDTFHYLPAFDELVIGYKTRTVTVPAVFESKAYNRTGTFYPLLLRDGQAVGNWARKDLSHTFFETYEVSEVGLDKAKNKLAKFRF